MNIEQNWDTTSDTTTEEGRMWAMFLHLSLLAGVMLPGIGLIVPVVLWQLKKGALPELEPHGMEVTNWLISALIYGAIGAVTFVFLIGIPILLALGVVSVVFPIIGGIKANNGEVWKYPLAISFFK
jgi:uncharacterized Tic20 family protein